MTITFMEPPWQKTVSRVQEYRAQSLENVQPSLPKIPSHLPKNVAHVPQLLLSERETEITESSPECLLSYLASGKWSSEEVTQAYLRRATLAQELVSTIPVLKASLKGSTDRRLEVNCITEVLPKQALSRAQALDRYLKEKHEPMGPLHGLPISVKEHIGMKGLTCNAAYVAWADKIAPDDALILRILWNAGCIFYARTTEPQTLVRDQLAHSTFFLLYRPESNQYALCVFLISVECRGNAADCGLPYESCVPVFLTGLERSLLDLDYRCTWRRLVIYTERQSILSTEL